MKKKLEIFYLVFNQNLCKILKNRIKLKKNQLKMILFNKLKIKFKKQMFNKIL